MNRPVKRRSITNTLYLIALCGLCQSAIGAAEAPFGVSLSGLVDDFGSSQECQMLNPPNPSGLPCYYKSFPSSAYASLYQNEPFHGTASYATSTVDLLTRHLSASAVASGLNGDTGSKAVAAFWDTISFSGISLTQTVTITLLGTASQMSGGFRAYARLGLIPVGTYYPNGPSYDGNLIPIGTSSSAFSYSHSFTVRNDVPMYIYGSVGVSAGIYGSLSVDNTQIEITAPDGVSFSSASGAFASPVPEPPGALLLVAGISLLAVTFRRRIYPMSTGGSATRSR